MTHVPAAALAAAPDAEELPQTRFDALLTSDLLPLIFKRVGLPHLGMVRFRQVSTEARRVYDQLATSLSIVDDLGGRWGGGDKPIALEHVMSSVRGKASRGRRPEEVTLHLKHGPIEERQHAATALLRHIATTAATTGSPMPTSTLKLYGSLLTEEVACAAASAFPLLSCLKLDYDKLEPGEEPTDGSGVAVLLGRSGGEGGSRTEGGGCNSERGGGTVKLSLPLLPHLSRLSLTLGCGSNALPTGVGAALRRCAQLRELRIRGAIDLIGARDVEDLASLTQLASLDLTSCTDGQLATLLASLTQLTRLRIRDDLGNVGPCWGARDGYSVFPAAFFAGLPGLQELTLPCVSIGVCGLGALTSLTALTVGQLYLPTSTTAAGQDGAAAGSGSAATAPVHHAAAEMACYPLPPTLRVFTVETYGLGGVSVAVLAALRPPHSLTEVAVRGLIIPAHFASADGTLLPAGQAALCAAAALLARSPPHTQHRFHGRRLSVIFEAACHVQAEFLQPAGAGGGSGTPHHGAWLSALGGLGIMHLRLCGISLTGTDLETITQHLPAVELMDLSQSNCPAAALPLLARLPRLRWLIIGIHMGNYNPPSIAPELPLALLALLKAKLTSGIKVDVSSYWRVPAEGIAACKAACKVMVAGVWAQLVAEGADLSKVTLIGMDSRDVR